MNIVCPQCQFTREVAEDRLPGTSAIATCPRCKHRFKVEHQPVHQPVLQPVLQGDDPLPPSAVILPKESPPPPDPTADEEYRKAALAAYERQAAQQDVPLANPWEHPQRDGYFAAFYQTIVRVMFNAPAFFSGLRPDTPQRTALFFYMIVTVLQILTERFWGEILSSMLSPHTGNDTQMQQLVLVLRPQTDIFMALLLRSAVGIAELFVGTGLYYVMFRVTGASKAHYALIFQVVAYSAAPTLLCVVPLVGSVAGLVWNIACTFVGCRHALGLTWSQTALALVPLYLLGIPIILQLARSVQGIAG